MRSCGVGAARNGVPCDVAVYITPIPPAVLAQIDKKVDEILALAKPYLIPLTKKERRELPKMGDKSLAFVQKATELADDNPALVPGYIDVAELRLDAVTAARLLPIEQKLSGFVLDVNSTRMIANSEGYVSALLVYGGFQQAARAAQPGAQGAVDQLNPRFRGQSKGGQANKGKTAKPDGE